MLKSSFLTCSNPHVDRCSNPLPGDPLSSAQLTTTGIRRSRASNSHPPRRFASDVFRPWNYLRGFRVVSGYLSKMSSFYSAATAIPLELSAPRAAAAPSLPLSLSLYIYIYISYLYIYIYIYTYIHIFIVAAAAPRRGGFCPAGLFGSCGALVSLAPLQTALLLFSFFLLFFISYLYVSGSTSFPSVLLNEGHRHQRNP